MRSISTIGLLVRLVAIAATVFLTWNPSGISFATMVAEGNTQPSVLAVMGVGLAVLWLFFTINALRHLGRVGIVAVLAVIGVFVWLLADFALFNISSAEAWLWLAPVATTIVLSWGFFWPYFRMRWQGVRTVEDADS